MTLQRFESPALGTDRLADAYRRWGYLAAQLDSLGRLAPRVHADIEDARAEADAQEIEARQQLYCGSIGVEFMHMLERQRVLWVLERMESSPEPVDDEVILRQLMEAELFEHFLHQRYVGTKRYSLEGCAAVVPLLDAALDVAAREGAEIALLAMSHRGRLTVLANVVNIPGPAIFAGFEEVDPLSFLGSGDVKYHLGATGTYQTTGGRPLAVHLVSNPSHLEAVNPVVMGRARARQLRLGEAATHRVVPITLHGDAAFAGQGITAETLNMADLEGYTVGGTLHVIVNNLIGFTTEPESLHSSRHASDLARRLDVPIFHVNGEDPPAVVRAARMAMEYRRTFGSDVVLDVIGYRRYGHSEVEDPTTTQPRLYAEISKRPLLWQSYAETAGISEQRTNVISEEIRRRLSEEQDQGRSFQKRPTMRTLPAYWNPYVGGRYDASLEVATAVDASRLTEIGTALTQTPDSFTVHRKIQKVLDQRSEMVRGERPVDWGMAESLAFGSLLCDGMLVRLAGEDSGRGTFNQRHAVLRDAETGGRYVPLSHLRSDQGVFEVVDSPLSEAAALGYEYGFSRDWPDGLVLWEAQFGDFVNGAQIIIDQFLTAGEDKWDLLSGLVMLLPHGYEGQGPEHSSARLERFLQLAAEDNIQVCAPSTAGQYFHLLRRQALRRWRKPLIVLTPKGLLRAAAASTPLEEFTAGSFHPVLGDDEVEGARRVLLCSGRIAHDLRAYRRKHDLFDTAIVRLAQLYPFPEEELYAELKRHGDARRIVWVQEEPANTGALGYIRPLLAPLCGDRHVTSVKRSASASPATGSPRAHAVEQQTLMELAFR